MPELLAVLAVVGAIGIGFYAVESVSSGASQGIQSAATSTGTGLEIAIGVGGLLLAGAVAWHVIKAK